MPSSTVLLERKKIMRMPDWLSAGTLMLVEDQPRPTSWRILMKVWMTTAATTTTNTTRRLRPAGVTRRRCLTRCNDPGTR